MTSKKELLSRIQGLESRVIELMQESTSRDWVENFVRNSTVRRSEMDFLKETVAIQGQVLQRYREVLLTSGLITSCDASRTEFQWQEGTDDALGRNFHFKVNKVITKKEKE